VLVLLASAVLVVALFRSLNLPPVLGYLLVGAAIGPHALNLVPDSAAARHLAEFGVVFLMFSIGLEFSLPRLYSMKRIGVRPGADAGAADPPHQHLVAVLAGLGFFRRLRPGRHPRHVLHCRSCQAAGRALELESSTAARSSACCCSRIWPWCRC
jgi:hypothetical protein